MSSDGDSTVVRINPILKFKETDSKVTTEFIWEIKNFPELTRMAEDNPAYYNLTNRHFAAGKEIGHPIAEWRVFLQIKDGDFGIYLQPILSQADSNDSVEVLAQFSICIMRTDGKTFSEGDEKHKFTKEEPNWGFLKLSTITELIDPKNNVLSNDALTIKIQHHVFFKLVTIVDENIGSITRLRQECLNEPQRLLKKMLNSKHFSDITLKTRDGQEFYGHKNILSGQSKVFDAMFSNRMSESETGIVNVDDMDADAFKTLLEFIYTGELDEKWFVGENLEQIIYGVDKYDLPLLKELCDKTLPSDCNQVKLTTLGLFKLAKLYNLQNSTTRLTNSIKSNPALITELLHEI